MSAKDEQRVQGLIDYAIAHGLVQGTAHATEEVQRITKVEKCETRAGLLDTRGFRALAAPFRHRARWLTANQQTLNAEISEGL